jgi:transposase
MQSQFIKDLITLPSFLIQGERWIFELSLPPSLSDLPNLLRTDNQNVIETKTMDSGYTK